MLGQDALLVFTICGCFAFTLALCLGFALYRRIQVWQNIKLVKRDQWAETVSLEFVSSRSQHLPKGLPATASYQESLVAMSSRFTGELSLRVMTIYISLGFARSDVEVLHSRSIGAGIKALKRCRGLNMPLPEETWEHLVRSPSRTMRWAAMDHLIAIKGKKSALKLMHFLGEKDNQRRGMAIHLLSQLADRSPQALLSIVEHSDDEFLINMCLEPLILYPVAGSESALMTLAKSSYSSKTSFLAMQAVAAIPSQVSLDFILALATDTDWEIRERVAMALGAFGGDNGVATLERLSEDISYPVRYQAVISLLALGKDGAATLERISNDPLHPSVGIAHDILFTQHRSAGEAS